jgi:hypothetical protein
MPPKQGNSDPVGDAANRKPPNTHIRSNDEEQIYDKRFFALE